MLDEGTLREALDRAAAQVSAPPYAQSRERFLSRRRRRRRTTAVASCAVFAAAAVAAALPLSLSGRGGDVVQGGRPPAPGTTGIGPTSPGPGTASASPSLPSSTRSTSASEPVKPRPTLSAPISPTTASPVATASPNPDTDPNGWLTSWTPRGSDAHDQHSLATDTSAAAGLLGVSNGSVHILYAGAGEDTSSVVVAVAVCQSCQSSNGTPVNVVVLHSQGNHIEGSLTAQATLGPGIGVFPFPTNQGSWSIAVVAGPGVVGAQVQTAQGGPWQDISLDHDGLGIVASLPDPTIYVQVRLLGDANAVLAAQQVTPWTLHGSWPGGFTSQNGSGQGGGHGLSGSWPA